MIEIKNLKKSYNNDQVLNGINLTIKKGDIFGFAGRSGTGKSTLLRCINGIESFESGSILVDQVDVGKLDDSKMRIFRKEIGMIFQNFSLMNRISVYDNIALPMKCWHYDKKEIDKKVKELLDVVGIPEKIHCKARELSGGQKQRVAIARALTMNPKVLLCDEATSALDPKSTNSIINLLAKINKELGITIIIVSHEMGVLRSVCENIAILENGIIEAHGTVENIFKDKPEALINLLGDKGVSLPKEGKNIELLFSKYNNKDPILSRLARTLNIDFSVVGSDSHNFKDDSITSYIINFDPIYMRDIKKFLDKNNILWHEIDEQTDKEADDAN
ncbi:MAG: methionine ABC transporter ATP-binding protein [Firmicutes bacterium]|nr:methionine ABC transporter ATP-binding protein [Bacillota bacterium]